MQIWVVCVLWVLGFCFALPVKAQDNPFKIDNGLYKLYLQAFKYRTSERCVGLSDTLYREANRLGDKKAACLAKTIPLSYYMNFGDSLTFVHWVKDVEETSRRNGYLQYYYHAYSNHIIWLLRRGHLFRALQLAEDMHRQAQKDENIYGLYSCIRRQGDIYRMRGDYRGAVECYKEAIQSYLEGTFTEEKKTDWDTRLKTVFNRGFWNGYYLGQRLGEWSRNYGSEATERKVYAGRGIKYFSNIGVAEFLIEATEIKVGDKLLITGPTTGAMYVDLKEARVALKPVDVVKKGVHVSFKVPDRIRPSDKLYRIVPAEELKKK